MNTHINDNIILLGDLNNDTNTSITPLNLLTTQLGLKSIITQTTRPIHNTSANTILDQIYINPNYHPRTISGILLEDITDHLPIYILIAKNKNNQNQTDTVTTEMAYDTFHSKYISIINECLPLTPTKIKSKKNSNEWITNKLKRYIHKRKNFYQII